MDKHVREAETASVTDPLPVFAKPVTHVMPNVHDEGREQACEATLAMRPSRLWG